MSALQLFTWGYWGWGTSARQLVAAVDAVESARGFEPPVFVDVRWKRQGRAADFVGSRFESLLGGDRYRWLQGLGNKAIDDGGMEIARPQDAGLLLDLAIAAAEDRRRLIFFCACEFPLNNAGGRCHRSMVAEVLLAAAKRRGVKAETAEWPEGKPERQVVEVSPADFAKLRRGGRSVPLRESFNLGEMAAVPWYSVAIVLERGTGEAVAVRVCAARFNTRAGEWYLPVIGEVRPADDVFAMLRESKWMHADDGYGVRVS
jgi:hypothetical protein